MTQVVLVEADALASLHEKLDRIEAQMRLKNAPAEWLTVAEYAEKEGITVKAAQMRSTRGAVETKGSGNMRRFRNPEI